MQTTVAYNEQEIKEKGSQEDIRQGYNIWVDLVDPTKEEFEEYRNYSHWTQRH